MNTQNHLNSEKWFIKDKFKTPFQNDKQTEKAR